MKETIIATYKRESTLWKNANGFYHAQDWTKMECKIFDYTEEINSIKEYQLRYLDQDGNDITEQEIEKHYGKPYAITLTNKRGNNSRCWCFKTKQEANNFFKYIMRDRILGDFKRVN